MSDGGAELIGNKNGFSILLKEKFEKENLVIHWCFNHRLELVFKPPLKQCLALTNIEKWANKLYSFYGSSPKRTSHLDEYMKEEGETKFRLHKGMTFHRLNTFYSHTESYFCGS